MTFKKHVKISIFTILPLICVHICHMITAVGPLLHENPSHFLPTSKIYIVPVQYIKYMPNKMTRSLKKLRTSNY